jgi:hypothetical protein
MGVRATLRFSIFRPDHDIYPIRSTTGKGLFSDDVSATDDEHLTVPWR